MSQFNVKTVICNPGLVIGLCLNFFNDILKLLIYFPLVLPHNYELHISGYIFGTPQEVPQFLKTPADKLRPHRMIGSYIQEVEDRRFLLRFKTPNPRWKKNLDYF